MIDTPEGSHRVFPKTWTGKDAQVVDGLLYLANPNSADCSRAGIGSRTPPSMLRATEVHPLQARKLHWSHALTGPGVCSRSRSSCLLAVKKHSAAAPEL